MTIQQTERAREDKPLTFTQCVGDDHCEHDFQGWREFEDGLGGEAVCAKCGIGAMETDQWNNC